MDIQLRNTLTKKKEIFKPIEAEKAGLYSCGPTVYGPIHVGNLRAFTLADTLRRVLEFNGYEVNHVMNITDVGHLVGDGDEGEDKLEVGAKREGKTAWDIAEFYTDAFKKDVSLMNIAIPDTLPKATDHIEEQIEMIKKLEENGYAYQISDGIYFDTSKLEDYGSFGGQKLEEKEEGARVQVNTEKRQASDFALWKFSPEGKERHMEWESPWGKGFPGWHLECSAMSTKYLGKSFDLHTGGIDLIPVHHENEIAQTRGAYGTLQANTWVHNDFVQIDGGKMSKSLGNVYNMSDIVEHGFDPIAFRYFVLGAHYAKKLNFTWEAVGAAQNALFRLRDTVQEWDLPTGVDKEILDRFRMAVNDDLDTPQALAIVWDLVGDEHLDTAVKAATLLEFDLVLGLGLEAFVAKPLEVSLIVQKYLEDRAEARLKKNWEDSDRLRDLILDEGYTIDDADDAQTLREKR
jgi:cysteinyl-tRNA synthetase